MNRFRNTSRIVTESDTHYREAYDTGVMGLYGTPASGRSVISASDQRVLTDFSRCSYLALDSHPQVVQGAIAAIARYGAVQWSVARTRLNANLTRQFETAIGEMWHVKAIAFSSVTLASMSFLPLLASGILTSGDKPCMVFDKKCHASLAFLKPVIADETEVITIAHNDMEQLEQLASQRKTVAYITDGVFSMGGVADLCEIQRIQQKWGLYLFVDDAHGVSVRGPCGAGFARTVMTQLDDRTAVAVSLAKGFGASGGLLTMSSEQWNEKVRRYGLGYTFSASPSIAAMGAAMASAEIHGSDELCGLQEMMVRRVREFDAAISTEHAGDDLPIRLVRMGSAGAAVRTAGTLIDQGYFTTPVFFPTVGRGEEAIRLCISAGHTAQDVSGVTNVLKGQLQAMLKPTR